MGSWVSGIAAVTLFVRDITLRRAGACDPGACDPDARAGS